MIDISSRSIVRNRTGCVRRRERPVQIVAQRRQPFGLVEPNRGAPNSFASSVRPRSTSAAIPPAQLGPWTGDRRRRVGAEPAHRVGRDLFHHLDGGDVAVEQAHVLEHRPRQRPQVVLLIVGVRPGAQRQLTGAARRLEIFDVAVEHRRRRRPARLRQRALLEIPRMQVLAHLLEAEDVTPQVAGEPLELRGVAGQRIAQVVVVAALRADGRGHLDLAAAQLDDTLIADHRLLDAGRVVAQPLGDRLRAARLVPSRHRPP